MVPRGIAATYAKISQRFLFTTYLCLFTLCIALGFALQLDIHLSEFSFSNLISVLSVFDLFFVELCILLLIGGWLLADNRFLRFLLYLSSSIFIVVYSIQFASFYVGGELLSRLAIDNINHIGLLLNAKSITGLILLSVLCLLLPVMMERKPHQNYRKPINLYVITIFCTVVFIVILNTRWLPKSVKKQRGAILEYNFLQHTAPISSLYKTLFIEGAHSSEEPNQDGFSPFELSLINSSGFHFNPDSEYPLIKDTIYTDPPPFTKLQSTSATPNIIVFFTEGFSARSMATYDSKFKELTPNLDAFAKTAMVVDNYYNHTAATYRGLHGQLCSLYPTYGGIGGWHTNYKNMPKTDYHCISNVFNNVGYETIFLDSHRRHASHVDEMMKQLGFQKVITGQVLSKRYLNNARPQTKYALSDKQFFRGLIGVLEDRKNANKVDEPFFMGLYNLGTHAFKKLTKDGKPFDKGNNLSLNTIHNLDNAFGLFWDYYKKSPFSKNTIIIFTADHNHYPEKPFTEAFKAPDYQKLFVDKIPFVIHDPTRHLPKYFDANYATSIGFTPSLIHYLNLGNHKNPFMGTSIFESHSKEAKGYGLNSYGKALFMVDEERIHKLGYSRKHRIRLKVLNKYIKKSKQLEVTNKLWDKNLTPVNGK